MDTLLLIHVLAGQDRNPFVGAEPSWLNHSFKGWDICLVSLSLSMPLKKIFLINFAYFKDRVLLCSLGWPRVSSNSTLVSQVKYRPSDPASA